MVSLASHLYQTAKTEQSAKLKYHWTQNLLHDRFLSPEQNVHEKILTVSTQYAWIIISSLFVRFLTANYQKYQIHDQIFWDSVHIQHKH